MKIKAKNLRGVTDSCITVPNGLSVLAAKNGTGKSTMALVPYWVLSGKGLSIKDKENSCYGEFELHPDFLISRKVDIGSNGLRKTTIKVNGKTVTEKTLKLELQRRNLSIEALISFFARNSDINHEDILKATGFNLDTDSILEMLNLSSGVDEFKSFISAAGITDFSMPEIAKIESYFVQERRKANRDLSAITITNNSLNSACSDVTGLKAKIKALNDELIELTKTRSELLSADSHIKLFNSLHEKLAEAKSNADTIAKRISAGSDSSELLKKEKSVLLKIKAEAESLKSKRKELETQLEFNKKKWYSINSDVKVATEKCSEKKSLIDLITSTTKCPLYDEINCTTDKAPIIQILSNDIATAKQHISELIAERTSVETAGHSIKDSIIKLDEMIAEQESMIENCNLAIASLTSKIEALSNDTALLDKERRNIEQIENDINKETMAMKSVSSSEDTSARIASLDDKIKKIQSEIASATNSIDATIHFEENAKNAHDLSIKVEAYNNILNGIRELPAIIVSKIIAPLQNEANTIISKLNSDWTLTFNENAEIIVYMKNRDMSVNSDELSSGEKTLLNFTIKLVLKKLLGLEYIILDKCDSLDPVNLSSLISMINSESINAILVLSNNNNIKATTINI